VRELKRNARVRAARYISDMVGTIVRKPLCDFTKRICDKFSIPTQAFVIDGTTFQLPGYKAERGEREEYIILVPADVLCEMPIALEQRGRSNGSGGERENTRISEQNIWCAVARHDSQREAGDPSRPAL